MADISYHRKYGFILFPPRTIRAERRAKSRDRSSPFAATLFVMLASVLLWAIIAAVIYAIVAVA